MTDGEVFIKRHARTKKKKRTITTSSPGTRTRLFCSVRRRDARRASPRPTRSRRAFLHTVRRAPPPPHRRRRTRLIQPCSFTGSSASASAIVEPSRVSLLPPRTRRPRRFSLFSRGRTASTKPRRARRPRVGAVETPAETSDEDSDTTSYPAATHICVPPRPPAPPPHPVRQLRADRVARAARHDAAGASSAKCSSRTRGPSRRRARATSSPPRPRAGRTPSTPRRPGLRGGVGVSNEGERGRPCGSDRLGRRLKAFAARSRETKTSRDPCRGPRRVAYLSAGKPVRLHVRHHPRTPSVVPRSQHVLRSYCWQNVKPRFFEGGLRAPENRGTPRATRVGALDLAATPAETRGRVATSDRCNRPVCVLPYAVILSRSRSNDTGRN